ncbi:MAG: phosphopyruvate hydratase [Lachnospiraceae bacterium]|nr:phosphopyruvate hydratase [Lachnospiraceae bacterium]
MKAYKKIFSVKGREILDSRGNPTVEATILARDIVTGCYYEASAAVPSGASRGQFEAVELRDGETRYMGLGVKRAVENINTKINERLYGRNVLDQMELDRLMIELDGTAGKESLGANAILAVSMAAARTAACSLNLPLYQYLGGCYTKQMPVPMMNILNGGRHATNTIDFQEFMILPVSAKSFSQGLQMCAEVYHDLKKICHGKGLSCGVGDEGGFAPDLPDAKEALTLIVEAIKRAGYEPETDLAIALDVAASELYNEADGKYHFPGETRQKKMEEGDASAEVVRDTQELIDYYEQLISQFPIASIEDGLAENDWDGWKVLTAKLGQKVKLVGDDLFVTNVKRLEAGIGLKAANAILIKPNQIGTITETMETIDLAHKNGYQTIISHRSGETEDAFIADLAVAVNCDRIKTGAPCRSERVSKYNQLLRIEESLKNNNSLHYRQDDGKI